jgi:uncharacterized damage-inducible protein DinB
VVEDGGMALPFPSPTEPAGSRAEVLLRYLAYFRGVLADKLRGLDDAELRRSRLPSGWTPLELVRHLTYVERRWLVWGFEGRDVGDPWGDRRGDRWYVEPGASLDQLLAELDQQAAVSARVVAAHDLEERGQPGDRWEGAEPATLERVLLHLVQEYARHVGHVDIVRELADGVTGK